MADDIIEVTAEHAAAIEAAIRAATREQAPSGVVYSPFFRTLEAGKFTAGEPFEVGLGEFRQIVWELNQGAFDSEEPAAMPASRDAVRDAVRAGTVPVATLDCRFEAIGESAAKRFLAGIGRDGTLDLNDAAAALVSRRVTLARPLIDTIADGADLTFSFEPDWRAGNSAAALAEILFDPDDGEGARTLAPGATVNVRYGSAGEKRLSTSLRFDDGHAVANVATLLVKAIDLPAPDIDQPVMVLHGNLEVRGVLKAYYADKAAGLVKPLFMWTGFDTGTPPPFADDAPIAHWTATAEDYLADPDIRALLERARKKGNDIVIVEFKDTHVPLEANATLVIQCIRLINAIRTRKHKGTILTGSMGGMVANYALLRMELESRNGQRPHDIAKTIFFDTPFMGAVIPMAAQYVLDYYSGVSGEARRRRNDYLDAPSARQMLVQKYDKDWRQQAEPKPHGDFGQFRIALNNLGTWPTEPALYAAASGSGEGKGQTRKDGKRLQPKDEMLHLWKEGFIGWMASSWLRAMPNFPDRDEKGFEILYTHHCGNDPWKAWPHKTLPWDSCPGGWFNTNEQISQSSEWTRVDVPAPNSCFVPTLSALAIPIRQDPYAKPPPNPGKPFKQVYVPDDNTKHCALTPEVTKWIEDILALP